jgi:hypothetical protein
MVNARSRNLWTLCWLGLALLVLLPESASAQRRRRFREDSEDPICYRRAYGVCQKFRLGVLGGSVVSADGATGGVGVEAGYTLVAAPRFEVGGNLFVIQDVRFKDGPYVGTAEAIVRVATVAGPNHRVFLQLGLGGSFYDSPEDSYWAFPAGSGGLTLELSGPGLGIFLTTGLSLLYAEGIAVLPRAGIGLVF